MKIFLTLIILIFIGCQSNKQDELKDKPKSSNEQLQIASKKNGKLEVEEQYFRDSLYNRESRRYISKLEEIPNRDSNAYKLTISLKNGEKSFSKIVDTRPKMSHINYCNDLYTVVGFPCGGPCYSQVFVFTDENRPIEQYDYCQMVKNKPNIIAHIRNEEFEKLIIHNFNNNKELTVDIADNNRWNYGQMDSMIMKKENLILYYTSEKQTGIKKTVSLKSILE
jgi:hypothetical protein